MPKKQGPSTQLVRMFPPATVESRKTSSSQPAKATNRNDHTVSAGFHIGHSKREDKFLDYIHQFMEGKKASDAHRFLDNLITTLNTENEEIEELPQDDEILLANPTNAPELPRTWQALPSSAVGPATAEIPAMIKMPAPSTSSATAASGPLFANVVPAAPLIDLSFLHQLQQQATVTQTIFITASPTTINTPAAASSTDNPGSNGSQKSSRYMDEGGGRNSSIPVIAMLVIFGAILVIGPLIAYCWWRNRKRAEKNNALPYFSRDMGAGQVYPPVVDGSSSYHNNNSGVAREQKNLPQRNMGADAFEASSSRRPSTAPSVNHNQSKFKGKARQLPPIDTSGLTSSEPPISPTFVPLPGTPMKLVPRQQVLSDPQRRRGVDALDLAAQRESNYKHWKAIKADDSDKSFMQPISAEILTGNDNQQRKTKEYVKRLVDESRNHPGKPSSISKNVKAELQRNTKESLLQTQPIELEDISITSTPHGDRNDSPSDVSTARLILQSVE